jgi:tetrahydromethanopterin S-methyltransferase subunit G
MTDRLTLIGAFEGAGITGAASERLATEICNAIDDNLATKADPARVETALRDLDRRIEFQFERIERRIDGFARRLIIRLGGLIVVGLGLLFIALHIWPPH